MVGIAIAERGLLPESLIRVGIRALLRARIREEQRRHSDREAALEGWIQTMAESPIALHADDANAQHYEVPARFFETVLGPHLKYSSGFWPPGVSTLEDSEKAMLSLTCERAEIYDGQRILELGCGWGSLALWIAEHFPRARVTAVSNSSSQRDFVLARAAERRLSNLNVITANMSELALRGPFDRIVSVEMFEHMRNWQLLLQRIGTWLDPGGKLFVHVFSHHRFAYPFEAEGAGNWMGRHFFTGGMMPSHDLLLRVRGPLEVEEQWIVPGTHYARTAEAWHERLLAHRDEAAEALGAVLSPREARRQVGRWRLFFLACAELFGFGGGSEWIVSHYRLRAGEQRAS